MIASITFDPRLMWDAAEAGRSAAPKESGAAQEAPASSPPAEVAKPAATQQYRGLSGISFVGDDL
jgi:hypothetical protein